MDELEKTTRRLSSFTSVDEVMEWLHYHDCYKSRYEIERIWEARQYRLEHPEQYPVAVNYRLQILTTKNPRKNNDVKIEKQQDVRERL